MTLTTTGTPDATVTRSMPTRLIGTTTAAVLLVIAALCDTLEPLIQPLSGATTEADLGVIAAHQDAFVASKLIGMVGTLVFLPALLGLLQHTVARAPIASRITAFFVVVGFPAFMGIRFGSAIELQSVRDGLPHSEIGTLFDDLGSNPLASSILGLFLVGTLLGMIALGVTLWRSGFPRVAAVLVAVFPIVDMGTEGHLPGWLSHLVLLVGVMLVTREMLRSERREN